MESWTALLVGFLGSFHCVGMCGPIAMSLPKNSRRLGTLWSNALLYNSGRILIYAIIGLLFGFLGTRFQMIGFQASVSVVLGILLLWVIVETYWLPQFRLNFPMVSVWNSFVQKSYQKLIHLQPTKWQFVGMGSLNGLLPCPFVYMGVAAAILSPSPLEGSLYMLLFGLGTFPAMIFMYLSPQIFSMEIRTKIQALYPYLGIVLALMFIFRGLYLYDYKWTQQIGAGIEMFCTFPSTEPL